MNCEVCENDIWYNDETESWYLRIRESSWNEFMDDYDVKDICINFLL